MSTGQNDTLEISLLFLYCGGTTEAVLQLHQGCFFLFIKKYHKSKNVFSGFPLQINLRTKSWKEKDKIAIIYLLMRKISEWGN